MAEEVQATQVANTDIHHSQVGVRKPAVTIYEEGKSWPCWKEDNPYLIEEEGVKEERGRKEEGRRRKEGGKEERRRKGGKKEEDKARKDKQFPIAS